MRRNEIRVPLISAIVLLVLGVCLVRAEETGSSKSAAAVIEKTILTEGIQAAGQVFAQMRRAAEGAYSFVEAEFIDLADRLVKEKKTAEAIKLLEMCREVFTDSPRLLYNLALICKEHGDLNSYHGYVRKTHLARQKIILRQYLEKNKDTILTTADGRGLSIRNVRRRKGAA